MLQHIGTLITLAIIDIKECEKREKLCLIEDIFKVRNLLIALGRTEFNPSGKYGYGEIFDLYMDQSIEDLTLVWAELSATAKNIVMSRAGFQTGTELLKP